MALLMGRLLQPEFVLEGLMEWGGIADWIGVATLLAVFFGYYATYLSTERIRKRQIIAHLDEKFGQDYIRIYRRIKSLDLSLENFFLISQKQVVSRSDFLLYSFEFMRENVLSFANLMDWRKNDAPLYLPMEIEEQCLRLRYELLEAMMNTKLEEGVFVERAYYSFNGESANVRRVDNVDLKYLERLSRKQELWPSVMRMRKQVFVKESEFMNEIFVNRVRKELHLVSSKLKSVFTG